jgi:hypothetical protein
MQQYAGITSAPELLYLHVNSHKRTSSAIYNLTERVHGPDVADQGGLCELQCRKRSSGALVVPAWGCSCFGVWATFEFNTKFNFKGKGESLTTLRALRCEFNPKG